MTKIKGKYNRLADFYDYLDSHYEKNIYSIMRKKFITKIFNSSVLEIGVGTGKNLPYYSNTNTILAIDISDEMLKKSYLRVKSLKKYSLDTKITLKKVPEAWHIKEIKFQYVVATFVLCTNEDPLDLIRNIYEVLEPGGRLLLFEWVPPKSGLRGKLIKLIHPFLYYLLGVSVYRKPSLNYFKKDDWILKQKEFFDQENVVLVLEKKAN